MRQASFPWGEDGFLCERCGGEEVKDDGEMCAGCLQEAVDEAWEALADEQRRNPPEPKENQ